MLTNNKRTNVSKVLTTKNRGARMNKNNIASIKNKQKGMILWKYYILRLMGKIIHQKYY